MSTAQRRQEILRLAEDEGRVDVPDLACRFAVSDVTIRTDLKTLSDSGLVVRTRGGAIPSTPILRELSLTEKAAENLGVKRRLAEAALTLISDGDAIILDSGTTTAEIAKGLAAIGKLLVMTNGFNVAQHLLGAPDVEVLMTGGKLRKKSQSFFGFHAEEALKHYNFDTLFLGVDGVDLQAGITTHFESEAILNRRMCDVAHRIVAVTDSSKFGRSSLHKICALEDIDILITDTAIPEGFVAVLEDSGVRLILVEPS